MALSKIPNYLQDLIDSDAIGAGAISSAKLPAGSVLQVVYGYLAGDDPSQTTSTSWTDVGLNVSITPKQTGSTILVMTAHTVGINDTGSIARIDYRALETESNVEAFRFDYIGHDSGVGGTRAITNTSFHGYFKPSDWSVDDGRELTFKAQLQKANNLSTQAGVIYMRWYQESKHHITAMEIAG